MSYWFGQVNLLEAATLTASSTAEGQTGHPIKEGQGSAAAYATGAYSGPKTRTYTVEIDSVAVGKEIGQATYRWRHSDSVSEWEATGVATSAAATELDSGVSIKWTSGGGDDFEVGDKWFITCTQPHGRYNLIDLNRDTPYRSQGLDGPNWIKADLGQAKLVEACILLDHNFSSGATITLQANDSDEWTEPAYTQDLSWSETTIVHFLNQTRRYWRLMVSDAENPEGRIELSEWFLGRGLEPAAPIRLSSALERGLDMSNVELKPRQSFSFEFIAPNATVRDELMALFRGLFSAQERRLRPVFFCFDTTSPSANTWLVELKDSKLHHLQVGPDHYRIPLSLVEAPKSNV